MKRPGVIAAELLTLLEHPHLQLGPALAQPIGDQAVRQTAADQHDVGVVEERAHSDSEAEGAQLFAPILGDLVRAPRRVPDPVDPQIVHQTAAYQRVA